VARPEESASLASAESDDDLRVEHPTGVLHDLEHTGAALEEGAKDGGLRLRELDLDGRPRDLLQRQGLPVLGLPLVRVRISPAREHRDRRHVNTGIAGT
jgi:hypothetical protein